MTYTHLRDLVILMASSVTYIRLGKILLLSQFFMTYAHLRNLVIPMALSVTYIHLGGILLLSQFFYNLHPFKRSCHFLLLCLLTLSHWLNSFFFFFLAIKNEYNCLLHLVVVLLHVLDVPWLWESKPAKVSR